MDMDDPDPEIRCAKCTELHIPIENLADVKVQYHSITKEKVIVSSELGLNRVTLNTFVSFVKKNCDI